MKKKHLILSLFLTFIFNYAFSQKILTIEIDGIRNNKGNIMLQVFDDKEKVITQEMSSVKDKKCVFTIKSLAQGKYAVRYYHDENINGKMDTNMMGIPVEGYGFSNNVTGKFGPPPFKEWLFDVSYNLTISLKPTY
jgi:uncharacterized protein (DUF2141 family)